MKLCFDNDKYLQLQSQKIADRLDEFGGKLYLEFGGKLFDDYHAARVLPGFLPDSKITMLTKIADKVEVVIAISAADIAKNKVRADIGITYDEDVLRLYDELTKRGLYVGSIVITQFDQNNLAAANFKSRLEGLGIKVYRHYHIDGYPYNVGHIVSDEGLGKNDFIQTSRNIVVVTAPGPGSGKMATCLSQMYQESKRGIRCGYAKYETFPVWNLPLTHPVNVAYEAATADLDDVNMIDPWHLQAYGVSAVNYNRDVEVFPVLNAIFNKVMGRSPYNSPTDMGVNMAGFCIFDDEACCYAGRQEIIRRYLNAKVQARRGKCDNGVVDKLDIILSKLNLCAEDRETVLPARLHAQKTQSVAACLSLPSGEKVFAKASALLSASAALLLNAVKKLANLPDVRLIAPQALQPIQKLKKQNLGENSAQLHADEALIALSVSASVNPLAELALDQLAKLKNCQAHVTEIPSHADEAVLRKLGVQLTSDANYPKNQTYFD